MWWGPTTSDRTVRALIIGEARSHPITSFPTLSESAARVPNPKASKSILEFHEVTQMYDLALSPSLKQALVPLLLFTC